MMAFDSENGRLRHGLCRGRIGVVGPLVIIGVGCVFLLDNFVPGFSFGRWWPMILVVVGAALLLGRLSGARSG